jgi:CRISPR-associated endonuclease/helicase Cas3
LPDDPPLRHLLVHLVTSHHGYDRPFAPVVLDPAPPEVAIPEWSVRVATEQRLECPLHRLESGIADRFWSLTRHFRWWGLAYLEAVLRLADQRASQREDKADELGTTEAALP